MLYFPQLASGTSGQLPLVRREFRRVIRTEQIDGREWKSLDGWAGEISWLLRYRGLTQNECAELEALFHVVEGRRGEFVFLDPGDNLLVWSEDLSKDVWTRDPFLELTSGIEDPLGGTAAAKLTNRSQAAQKIDQALAVPSWFQHCLSGWVRSDTGAEVTLFGRCGSAGHARTVRAESRWKRASLPVKLGGTEEIVRFGLEVGAGQSIEVFGLQVEAQAGASNYKRTRSRSGIYRDARFDQDTLEIVAEAPHCFGCTVTVVASL